MSLEKQQQKNTIPKNTHLNLGYVDYEDVYSPYIFKFNLNTITYKPMIAIYKYKSVWNCGFSIILNGHYNPN